MNSLPRVCLPTLLTSVALLTGCAPVTRVVLLPQANGKPSAVVVRTKGGEAQTISRPYARATATLDAPGAPVIDRVTPKSLKSDYKDLFDLMPPPAQRFTVYFEAGGTALTAASQVSMEEALNAALARSGGEIVVTGHTDTMGQQLDNDALSLARAAEVRQLFLARGFPPSRIEAVGRGERELATPTTDEVAEPSNRRVTIEVR